MVPRLLALSFIWGWSFLFIRVAGEALTPTAVAGGRTLLGAVVLLAFLRIRGIPFPHDRKMLGRFLVIGAVGSAIPFTLLAWGGQYIDSGLSAVLNASTPLFTAGLAVPLLGERLRLRVVLGLLIGLAGVAVVAGVGGADVSGADALAALAPVAAGACYGLTFCYAARHLLDLPPVVAGAGQVLGATVLLAPAAIVTTIDHGEMPSARQVGALVLLGVLGSGVAYVLSFRIVADMGPTVASLVTYIIPVVALGVGALVVDESITLRTVIGGAIIVGSVALVTRARRAGAARALQSESAADSPLPAPDIAPAPQVGPSTP